MGMEMGFEKLPLFKTTHARVKCQTGELWKLVKKTGMGNIF